MTDKGPFPVDLHSWHTATALTDTYLCTYVGASSEGLPNGEAQRCVDVLEKVSPLVLRCCALRNDAL